MTARVLFEIQADPDSELGRELAEVAKMSEFDWRRIEITALAMQWFANRATERREANQREQRAATRARKAAEA